MSERPIDRLIQMQKDGLYDDILVALDAVTRKIGSAWPLFDQHERLELERTEQELAAVVARFRQVLKGPRDPRQPWIPNPLEYCWCDPCVRDREGEAR